MTPEKLNQALLRFREMEQRPDDMPLLLALQLSPHWNDFVESSLVIFKEQLHHAATGLRAEEGPIVAAEHLLKVLTGMMQGAFLLGYRARELETTPEPRATIQ